jgi:hypothetical protein
MLLGNSQSVALDVRKIEPAMLVLDLTLAGLKRFDAGPNDAAPGEYSLGCGSRCRCRRRYPAATKPTVSGER